jgi:nucleotide-binding universal stress UspA family protein
MVGDPELLEEFLPSTARVVPWPFLARLPVLLAEAQGVPGAYRELLRQGHEDLKARFLAEESIETLVHARAQLVDAVLREVCRVKFGVETPQWALVAVGGYGRGELRSPAAGASTSRRRGSRAGGAVRRVPVGHRARSRTQRAHRRRMCAGKRG